MARRTNATTQIFVLRPPHQNDRFAKIGRLDADRRAERHDQIVLVEQFYDFAAELADQYLVMERGEIIQRGRGKDMEAEGVRQLMAI